MDLETSKLIKFQRMTVIYRDKYLLTTSSDPFINSHARNFSSLKMDEFVNDLDDFVEKALAEEKYKDVGLKVERYFKNVLLKNVATHIAFGHEDLFNSECKENMQKTELLTFRRNPRIYSHRERFIINNFNTEEFKTFFTNEIICVLNFIERYKKGMLFNIIKK